MRPAVALSSYYPVRRLRMLVNPTMRQDRYNNGMKTGKALPSQLVFCRDRRMMEDVLHIHGDFSNGF
jgi:hypothetical protein